MIPYTDYECRLALDELYRGDKVVLPTSIEHAKFMIMVAQSYINQQHQDTLDALKKDYSQ
jgi:preprotein translocase subunit YajC